MFVLSETRRVQAPRARRAPCAASLAALAAAVALLFFGAPTGSDAAWCGGLPRTGLAPNRASRPSVIARAAEDKPLVFVKAPKNRKSLAMAIVARLVEGADAVTAEGIGKDAVYNAVRSAIYAQEMLAQNHGELLGDKKVQMRLSRKKTVVRGEGESREAMAEIVSYSLGEAFVASKLEEADWLKSGGETNVGRAAGALKARLTDKGEAGISGIGSGAVGNGVRVVQIAEGYLKDDGAAEAELVVEPAFAKAADNNGNEITAVKLRVMKA